MSGSKALTRTGRFVCNLTNSIVRQFDRFAKTAHCWTGTELTFTAKDGRSIVIDSEGGIAFSGKRRWTKEDKAILKSVAALVPLYFRHLREAGRKHGRKHHD